MASPQESADELWFSFQCECGSRFTGSQEEFAFEVAMRHGVHCGTLGLNLDEDSMDFTNSGCREDPIDLT